MEAQVRTNTLKDLISDYSRNIDYKQKEYHANILGSDWVIKVVDELSNPDIEGLCCIYNKTIYLIDPKKYYTYNNEENFFKFRLVIRHELIHAFVYESGIDNIGADDEQTTNWLAYQYDKIKELFDMLER